MERLSPFVVCFFSELALELDYGLGFGTAGLKVEFRVFGTYSTPFGVEVEGGGLQDLDYVVFVVAFYAV